MLKVKKIHPDAVVPSKRKGDSGYDLYAIPNGSVYHLPPGQIVMIPTGIAIEIPEEYGFIIKERGSTGSKGLAVRCGVIDSSFRSEIFVVLNNTSNKEIYIGPGADLASVERMGAISYPTEKAIAQGMLVPTPHWEVQVVDELSTTDRGDGKLGSSGK